VGVCSLNNMGGTRVVLVFGTLDNTKLAKKIVSYPSQAEFTTGGLLDAGVKEEKKYGQRKVNLCEMGGLHPIKGQGCKNENQGVKSWKK